MVVAEQRLMWWFMDVPSGEQSKSCHWCVRHTRSSSVHDRYSKPQHIRNDTKVIDICIPLKKMWRSVVRVWIRRRHNIIPSTQPDSNDLVDKTKIRLCREKFMLAIMIATKNKKRAEIQDNWTDYACSSTLLMNRLHSIRHIWGGGGSSLRRSPVAGNHVRPNWE